MKTHLLVDGVDCRDMGQTEFEYSHQTACGYVRDQVTYNMDEVDCFYCLLSKEMEAHHLINKTLDEIQGCF